MSSHQDFLSRRRFLTIGSSSCSAYILGLIGSSSARAQDLFKTDGTRKVLVEEKWGRIEDIGDGLWGLVSTPFKGDGRTLCNGGLVKGDDRVLAFESFNQPAGSQMFAEWAKKTTGKSPTDIVISHHHPDHSGGIAGYLQAAGQAPRLWMTKGILDRVERQYQGNDEALKALKDAKIIDPGKSASVNLGGRKVKLTARSGHTGSDLTVEVKDPSVVWCGDLVWNNMFPNYGDAKPADLEKDVKALLKNGKATYVGGHGPISDQNAVEVYLEILQLMKKEARRALRKKLSPAEAAKGFKLPAPYDKWILFNPRYFELAFRAWERELR